MRRHVVLVALQNLLGEGRLLGLGVVAVLEAVALLIGLSRDIKSVFVAEFVPNRVVGIVARAHSVDVQPLHNLNVLNHPLTRHHVAAVGVDFVAVRTLDQNRFSVHQQLRVLDFHAAETDFDGNDFDRIFGKLSDTFFNTYQGINLRYQCV